jgi:alpha-N-acetylglucosaminidase
MWNGLLRTFYLPRWRLYTNAVLAALGSDPFQPVDDNALEEQLKEFEEAWVADPANDSGRMGVVAVGSSIALARELLAKYL